MLYKKDREKILFFRESSFRVASLIFNYPHKIFHLRKLAKETGFSTTAVSDVIDELERFKIVEVEKTDITLNIRADLESEAYRFYKKIFNLYRLERWGIVEHLREAFQAKAIVLFGSFAKGEDIEQSDIDILILTNRKKSKESEKFSVLCEKELNRNLNLHLLPSLDRSSPEFKNAVANGTVLYGYVKII